MEGENGLTDLLFTINTEQHEHNVKISIDSMENNKAVGTDAVHVEIVKTNAGKTSELLTAMWRSVGRCTVVPKDWLKGITVPLFKGKGRKLDPENYRSLTIISHLRKLTEKAVVLELDKRVTTDKAQFVFLAGV